MKLNHYKKGFFVFGLILFLGVSFPFSKVATIQALANETQDIKLNVSSQTIVKGKSFSIYVYNLSEGQTATFVSSSPTIASVNEAGTVTGNLVGTTTISVTITEGEQNIITLPCKIQVGPPAISVQFSRLELYMTIGQKLTLERIIQPLNTVETAKFSSQNTAIATVSAGGRVTAKSEGSTYIFAQIANGQFATCKINVYSDGTSLPENTEDDSTPLSKNSTEPTDIPTAILDDAAATKEALETSNTLKSTSEKTEGIDFETFIKNLNATDKTAQKNNTAESNTDTAN